MPMMLLVMLNLDYIINL